MLIFAAVLVVSVLSALAWDISTTSSDPKSDEMHRGIEEWRAVRRSLRR